MTEQELIRGIISREREAIATLVETYQHKVIKTAYYFLGDMQDAEDVAQEVFLEVLASVGRFRGEAALATWISRITVNRSLNELKRRRRRDWMLRAGSYIGMGHAGQADGALEQTERRLLIDQTVGALPENQRTAFILSKYEELSYKEIAEVMEVSIASVESLLHRARLSLQKNLAGHFSEYQKKKS